MSTLQKITKNSLAIFSGRIGALLLNTVTVVFLARYWDKELFGIFSFALIFIGFFGLLSDFGMQPILIREISRNRSKAEPIISHAFALKFFLALCAIGLASGYALMVFDHTHQIQAIAILSLTIIFSTKTNTVRISLESVFYADMEMTYPVLFHWVDAICQTTVVLILIALKASPLLILWGYVLANIPGIILTLVTFRQKIHLRFRFEKEMFFWLLRESSPLFLYLGLKMINERLDILFLKVFWGDTVVGLYSSAFRLTTPLIFIPIAVTTTLYPLMSQSLEDSHASLKNLFTIGSKVLLFIGITIGVGGMLIGKPIFLFLYGEEYSQAIHPFQLLLWSQCLSFLIFFLVDFNNSQNRQKTNTLFVGMLLLIALVFQGFLTSQYGAIGAAWAKLLVNLIGILLLTGLSLRSTRRLHPNPMPKNIGIITIFFILLILSIQWVKIPAIVFFIVYLVTLYCLFSRKEWIFLSQSLSNLFRKANSGQEG